MKDVCYKITLHSSNSQEEADTIVCLNANHTVTTCPGKFAIVRNPSGDADVLLILLSTTIEHHDRIITDFNRKEYCKIINLSKVNLSQEEKKCLIGFHAFTGNDNASSFFRKGKGKCWNVLQDNHKFVSPFVSLGDDWLRNEEILKQLEIFVCILFGSHRLKKANDVRYHIFQQKYQKDNRFISCFTFPTNTSASYFAIDLCS